VRKLSSGPVRHPSLGAPPPDLTAGFPAAGERIRQSRQRLAARALEAALANVPGLRERYDEVGLRHLLRDAELIAERIGLSVAANDPYFARNFAGTVAIVFRRRRVPMDDVIALCEGLRLALPAILDAEELVPANLALDEAIEEFRWYRRLAGDARKRNPILEFIYKGG
jgi:hypothetical protein